MNDLTDKAGVAEPENSNDIPAEEKAEADTGEKSFSEELIELRDKYTRLYAEFQNYKKRMQKDKEELLKYGNETLLNDLLPVVDNLEMAVKHSSNDNVSAGLVQGVEITLREFLKVLDRFGLAPIPAFGKMFDPALHDAMAQIEKDDVDDNTVVEEFRKGYIYKGKVLRPSLVGVSKKPSSTSQGQTEDQGTPE